MSESLAEDMRELDNYLVDNVFLGGIKLNKNDHENFKRLK